jgi:ABC-type Fe3+ transport system permease subunit
MQNETTNPENLNRQNEPVPNSTAVLILSILAVVTCLCYGILGIILAVIALFLYKKGHEAYSLNPGRYSPRSYSSLTTGRAIAIVALIISVLYTIFLLYMSIVHPDFGERILEWLNEQQNQ